MPRATIKVYLFSSAWWRCAVALNEAQYGAIDIRTIAASSPLIGVVVDFGTLFVGLYLKFKTAVWTFDYPGRHTTAPFSVPCKLALMWVTLLASSSGAGAGLHGGERLSGWVLAKEVAVHHRLAA
jgi:hypothetical protein